MAELVGKKGLRIGLRLKFTGWLVFITGVIMVIVMPVVRSDLEETLEHQIKARGLAMARNLASSCVEPMQLPTERMLSLMLLAKEYVQTGGGPEARRRLLERKTLGSLVWEYFKRFGRGTELESVRNEGVLAATVVDASGVVAAYADAVKGQEEWFEEVDQLYVPESDAGVLPPGEEQYIWNSTRNGTYLIAVAIGQSTGAGVWDAPSESTAIVGGSMDGVADGVNTTGEAAADVNETDADLIGAGADATPGASVGAGEDPAVQRYGVVYLAMSRGLVTRTVARVVAVLIWVGVGVVVVSMLLAMIVGAALTRPIRMLESGVKAIAAGDFGKVIPIKRSDEIGELADAFNDMAKGLAERETMRGAFSTFVSGDLLAEIIKNPDALKIGGARRVATTMFCYFGNHYELGGLAERLDPEELVSNINDYLGVQAHLVAEHGGYLDKFIGDVVLAVWGVPLETTDHAMKTVVCAVAIQRAVAELNEKRSAKGRQRDQAKNPKLGAEAAAPQGEEAAMTTDISIGINTGPLVAGNMGSEGTKLDYTVIGEDVNYAARLAGAGATLHGGSIWIGQNTFNLVKNDIEFKSLGDIEFKGLGVRPVIEVLGMKPGVTAASH